MHSVKNEEAGTYCFFSSFMNCEEPRVIEPRAIELNLSLSDMEKNKKTKI